ncbi:RagB/SusD family nutrient uptake outer membrane protein [Mucilaginibacter sp.]|uniref:RagB/SusD family nutrient uptake outer membrane protein n=1 Tax=Mucilaginibacter sp. TaxID=1882438 RepID=UPI003B003628
MKRKYIYSFCIAMAASVLVSSCKKDFLETAPTDQVSAAAVFTTTSNAAAAMNGVYRLMFSAYDNQDESGEGSVMIDIDMLGEDLVNPTVGNNWFISLYRYITTRSVTASQTAFVYRYYYRLISNANAIIEGVEGATGTDAEKSVIRGEALAIRAYAHFKLVQLYAQRYAAGGPNTQLGIPINITTTVQKLPRSTVEEVYAQINKDLNAAITNLGTAPARLNKSHINLSVAQGMKARVALAMQDYPTAATFAAQARMSASGISLMSNTDYTAGFNNLTNSEWMWGINQIADQGTFFYSFFAYMSVNFSSTNIRGNPKCINSTLYDQIPATDIRKSLWDPTAKSTAFPVPPSGSRFPYMNRKFLANSASNSYGDLPFMRLAEMYLIEAEANARQGKNAEAQNALYTLAIKRNPSYVKSASTGTNLINEIMLQRRSELWGEGFRFTDLKRLNLPLNRNGANHVASVAMVFDIPVGDQRWQWLFPQAEINANNLIVQNPN